MQRRRLLNVGRCRLVARHRATMPIMPAPRGKRVALVVGTIAVVARVGGSMTAWDRLIEPWHIWRLSSEDPKARYHAVEALVAMKSVRGAREMVRLLKEWRFAAVRGGRWLGLET